MRVDLLEEARRLTVNERVALAEAIWDTVAEDAVVDDLAVPEDHQLELDRRLADIETHPEEGCSWAEVRSRLERPL